MEHRLKIAESPVNRIIAEACNNNEAGTEARKELFDFQVNNLIKKEYPERLGIPESNFRSLVNPLEEYIYQIDDLADGRIPFLIVINIPVLYQLSAIELNGNLCFPHTQDEGFDIDDITDVRSYIDDPHGKVPLAHIICNINIGLNWCGKSPLMCEALLQKCSRFGLTLTEGIALCSQFPDILTTCNIDLTGSYVYRSSGGALIPHLYVYNGGPALGLRPESEEHPDNCSASRQSVHKVSVEKKGKESLA